MEVGDFVIIKDVLGCLQTKNPTRILCTDNVVREFTGDPTVIITGQQYALLLAEKAVGRLRDEHKEVV